MILLPRYAFLINVFVSWYMLTQHTQESKAASAGIKSTVESDLKTLKSDSDTLISALESKAQSQYLPTATSIAAKIDNAFQTAIAAYA